MTRRSLLGKMVFATAGVLTATAGARAQQLTTEALGEEGGRRRVTLLLGEDGGQGPSGGSADGMPPVTTEPFGEEAGNVTSRPVSGLEDGFRFPKELEEPTTRKGETGGLPRTEALNEGGGRVTKPVNEDGTLTLAKLEDGGPPALESIVVQPLTLDVADRNLDKIWAEMGCDVAGTSLQACAQLYGAREGLTYLKGRLNLKIVQPDEKELAGLIRKLDDNEYSVREDAEARLIKFGPAIKSAIEKALKNHESAEMHMRLNRVMTRFKESNPTIQAEHGVEVLIALRTAEAKQLLKDLAARDEKDWLAQKARQALDRVK